MTDIGILTHIRQLDSAGAVSLARRLIHSEAGRLGLPLTEFSMSGRVFVGDEGIDGRTNFPDGVGCLLPVGSQVWQVKSGATPPSPTPEFNESTHGGLIRAIQDGSDYVLFWSFDPVDPVLINVRTGFESAAEAIRAGAKVALITADRISRICEAHPAVLFDVVNLGLRGVVNHSTWGASPDFQVPFKADELRETHMATIRRHVSSEDATVTTIHLYGDSGVGKSRLVYEALMAPEIESRVLIARDSESLDASLINRVAGSSEQRLVLVVDDCEPSERDRLRQYADMAGGRVRLITIGSRWTRERPSSDSRYLELLPLTVGASREIALAVGLSESDANLVADFTEGYPKLALLLAEAIHHQEAASGVLDRIRGNEQVGSVLSSMLDSQTAEPLGLLAMFDRLGFEGEVALEMSTACEVFGVDPSAVIAAIEQEHGRFVSQAGRYRLVTPRLFAVWLAAEFLESHSAVLSSALEKLPPILKERIVGQMETFSGDPLVSDVLTNLLRAPPFVEGALADLDEGAARLVRIAAVVDPDAAAEGVFPLLERSSRDEIERFERGRREIVQALEVLLWFESTYEGAAFTLLRLAMAENESWANNATGIIQGSFGVMLGGTSVAHQDRLDWARLAIERYGAESAEILIPGLAHALEIREVRASTYFGTRSAPQEWRPSSEEEDVDVRRETWRFLIELGHGGVALDILAESLAVGLRSAVALFPDDAREGVAAVSWAPRGRSVLADAISNCLRYEEVTEEVADALRELRQELRGGTTSERLASVTAASPWELWGEAEERSGDIPAVLTNLADDLLTERRELFLTDIQQLEGANHQSIFMLASEIGRLAGDESHLETASRTEQMSDQVILGLFAGLATSLGESWARDRLIRWLEDNGLGRLVVRSVYLMPPSEEACQVALDAIHAGAAEPGDLSHFVFGAWFASLSEECLRAAVLLLAESPDDADSVAALEILSQWLDRHDDFTQDLNELAIALVERSAAIDEGSSGMGSTLRRAILERIELTFEDRLRILVEETNSRGLRAPENAIRLLEEMAAEDPERAVAGFCDVLISVSESRSERSSFFLEEASILSRLDRLVGVDTVINTVLAYEARHWVMFMRHIDLQGPDLDPLFSAVISSSTDGDLGIVAASRAIYPGGGWKGPESVHLAERKIVIERWRNETTDTAVEEFLRGLLGELDRYIDAAERDEAERGY